VNHRLALAAFALALAPLAGSPAPAGAAETLAVVPFAQPGAERNEEVSDATGILTTTLTERGITVKTIDPINHLAAVGTAAQICAKTGASGIIVPMVRTEQHVGTKNYILTTIQYQATHAELRLSLLRCDGSLAWSTIATGDKEYMWSNAQAGVSDTLGQAVHKALDAYAKRPATDAAPLAVASVPPAAGAAPSATRIAIVPFAQPGSPDPSLDFATEQAQKRFAAGGADVVVTDPIDELVATKQAAALCARYGAAKLVMGALRSEQTPKFAGIATHVEMQLTTVDCTGTVIATQEEIGDHMHHGANFRAGVSAAIDDAFGHWAQARSSAKS
jgi:hypothetical protein